MSVRKALIAASVAAGIYPWPVSAAPHQEPQPAPGRPQAGAESVQCAHAQPAIASTIEAAMARLETARQANSPAQMRAAIDDLQGALRDVRVQLAPCAAMSTATEGRATTTPPAATASPGNMPATKPAAASPPAVDPHVGHTMPMVAPSKELRQATVMDPVTGLMVDPATAPKTTYQGQTYYFSSEEARRDFLRDPVKFVKKPKQ